MAVSVADYFLLMRCFGIQIGFIGLIGPLPAELHLTLVVVNILNKSDFNKLFPPYWSYYCSDSVVKGCIRHSHCIRH
jgi:hypothetical protein